MRLKTLNGAPLPENLDFDEHALFTPGECMLLLDSIKTAESSDDASTYKWRRLGDKDSRLHTGWSQPYLPGSGRRFEEMDVSLTMPYVEQTSVSLDMDSPRLDSTADSDEQPSAVDTFLQHSFVFHDTLLSSQVVQDLAADQTISSSSFLTTTFSTNTSETSIEGKAEGLALTLQVSPNMSLSSLGTLPSAYNLRSIYPQTPTPNVLCVLMTHPERREVFVRKGGYKMDLYEITVADDTSSDFKVSFWLRPPRNSNNEHAKIQQPLLKTLEDIKVGDILLLRNIALTAFRDTVYGQSLNPSISRARTTIDVLLNNEGARIGQLGGLPVSFVEAFTKVKKWARTHVAPADVGTKKRRDTSSGHARSRKRKHASSHEDDSLPPDTLESI
jgi:hypothetical protein